jgi:LysM repeat protein
MKSMPLKRLLIVVPLFASLWLRAQKSDDIYQYINTYKELAMQEMVRSGIPASVKLAQGIHETMAGKSDLVVKSNNHFGIKCKTSWAGDKVFHDDDARGECFRSYASPSESYVDHSNFLKGSPRYAFLFSLDPTDYKAWAYGLKKAGYATNIRYSQIIIKLIEDYNLQQYSLIALGKLSPKDEILVGNPNKPASDGAVLAGPVIIATAPAATIVEEMPEAPKAVYPEGQFTINNTKVIYAKAGSSLLAVAQQYDVSLKRLMEFNDLNQEDVLTDDQLLYLQRKRKVGANEKHTVLRGESVYDICQTEGIRFESLLEYNHLQGQDIPAAGEILYLQAKAPGRPKLATEVIQVTQVAPQITDVAAVNYTTHTVQTKETLYSIARKYGITVEQLKAWNKIDGFDLKIGQALIIYKN